MMVVCIEWSGITPTFHVVASVAKRASLEFIARCLGMNVMISIRKTRHSAPFVLETKLSAAKTVTRRISRLGGDSQHPKHCGQYPVLRSSSRMPQKRYVRA